MSSEGNYSWKITDWSCNLLLISFSQIVFPEHLAYQTIPAPTQPPPKKKKRCFGETNSKTTTYCIWGTQDVTENLTNSHLIQRLLNYNPLCGTPIEPSQNSISKKTVWKISCNCTSKFLFKEMLLSKKFMKHWQLLAVFTNKVENIISTSPYIKPWNSWISALYPMF